MLEACEIGEFKINAPIKRRGFTTIEARMFLQEEFPQVKEWTCWTTPGTDASGDMVRLVGSDETGNVGPWSWERVPTSYPELHYWTSEDWTEGAGSRWVGAIKVRKGDEKEFIMFSYLDSSGQIGRMYFVSGKDAERLSRFASDVHSCLARKDKIIVERPFRRDLEVSLEEETLVLDSVIQREIETQVDMFYGDPEAYRAMGIPYRRGFLFVGPPGTGKTMMVRRIIRRCRTIGNVTFLAVPVSKNVDDDDLELVFGRAIKRSPSLVILEDLDSLTTETQVTRAGLLAQLDGLSSREGILIIGTTNHPESIDPALAHRPCRFDRVWKFGLPDKNLRMRYLKEQLGLTGDTAKEITSRSEGWSFAYLNEMRVTASLIALRKKRKAPELDEIWEAVELLGRQHYSGEHRHEVDDSSDSVGFAVA